MNKRLFAGLFIVQGLLGLVASFAWQYSATAYSYRLAIPATLMSCAQAWIGIGLLRNQPLARWLALGAGCLMILGGVLVPIITIVAGGYFEVAVALLGWGMPPAWLNGIRWLALLTVLYSIVAAIIALKGFRYLRSHEGRMEFGGREEAPGILSHESVGVIVASAITWIFASWLSTQQVTIMATSLPRFLQTAEMKRVADENHAKDVLLITAGAFFSLDSKHVVFPPSTLSPAVLVLDLASGKLRRTKLKLVPTEKEFHRSIAPDASSLVGYGATWNSLLEDEFRDVKSLGHERLGFHSPTRLLQYDSRTEMLELVDLENDRKVYSLPVSKEQRGEPSSRESHTWSNFSHFWSPDRRRYAWINRDNTLSVLDVDSGELQNVACQYCSYGSMFSFSDAGAHIFVPDAVTRGTDSPRAQTGGLLDIATEEWTSVSYRGDPDHVAADGSAAAFTRYQDNAFDYRELATQAPRQWTLEMPAEFAVVRTSGKGKYLVTFRKGEHSGATAMYATFEQPEDRGRVEFMTIASSLEGYRGDRPSPDSRYLLRVSGPKIELIDLEAALSGREAMRTMDVLEDEQLSDAKIVQSNPGVTENWAELRLPEVQTQGDASEFLARAQDSVQPAQPMTVPETEAPAPATPAASGIVKCIDSSGSVTFTQGSCPPGTRSAETPALDSAPSQPYKPRAESRASPTSSTLNLAMRAGDKAQDLKMHTKPCPGKSQLQATYFEMSIKRASGGTDVVFSAGKSGRTVFPSAEAALEGACALL